MEKTRIRELREEKGWTQMQLAKEIGVNRRSISEYERGRVEPSIQTIKALCKLFECTSDYLLCITEF
ncbi:MAG: helix-turn-helix transcriptional regulator [Firmicutes bacterium]|nr:helix-turn-helix transcriptional regulator [Bacillota bacterium]